MSKPVQSLYKVEWKNIPITVPVPVCEAFDQYADVLGTSRNSAINLALKFGGPLLAKYVEVMRRNLELECQRIDAVGTVPCFSEILGPPAIPGSPAMQGADERRKRKSDRKSVV